MMDTTVVVETFINGYKGIAMIRKTRNSKISIYSWRWRYEENGNAPYPWLVEFLSLKGNWILDNIFQSENAAIGWINSEFDRNADEVF